MVCREDLAPSPRVRDTELPIGNETESKAVSVQFGRWSYDGQPVGQDYIDRVSGILAPYGPDGNGAFAATGISILYHAFHTTEESHAEKQPYISRSDTVITWDGRLDNRDDLIREFRDLLTMAPTDVAIVSAAYEKWGTRCLAKLVGDWALSIWNPTERSILLAKDPIGTRHLYYSYDHNQVTWSTILDPLVLLAGKAFKVCEEYLAGWFSYFPAVHLTPYLGILSVPASSFVLLRPRNHATHKYWDFGSRSTIRYRTDAEYEDHFRVTFRQAVQRRLRSDRPVLAELSGGIDSASIVCMADAVMAPEAGRTDCLDTISWFDDSFDSIEPDSNEFHWIQKVEQKRCQRGFHINLRVLQESTEPKLSGISRLDAQRFAATPNSGAELSEHLKQYAAHVFSRGYRVILSGIGGDEVTFGGVPTPTTELQDLLARGRFLRLTRQLRAWAIKMRRGRIPLFRKAVQGFLSLSLTGLSINIHPPLWLEESFARRNYDAVRGYPSRLKLFGPLPSFQENIAVLNVLRRLLADWSLQVDFLREVRFPYLDRDFLEFLYAIPRDQAVGVGKRRFLMKRALAGIVPDEVLNRRRKSFVTRQAKDDVLNRSFRFVEDGPLISGLAGIIDQQRLEKILRESGYHDAVSVDALERTLAVESWMRRLATQKLLDTSKAANGANHSLLQVGQERNHGFEVRSVLGSLRLHGRQSQGEKSLQKERR